MTPSSTCIQVHENFFFFRYTNLVMDVLLVDVIVGVIGAWHSVNEPMDLAGHSAESSVQETLRSAGCPVFFPRDRIYT